MAVNLASKFAKQIDKRFRLKSLTEIAVGVKHDFIGVQTVKVYAITSQPLGDYTRTGADRYGTPGELQDTVQELTLAKDRSNSITVDKGNYKQGMEVKTATEVTAMQMDEVFTPELDTYRLAKLAAVATTNSNVATAAITASNAYDKFLDGTVSLDNDSVPTEGRVAFVTPTFFKFIKQDVTAILASEAGQKVKFSGMMGELDGVKIVKVPSNRMPANAAFIIMHPSCFSSPKTLSEAKVHIDPPGISGTRIDFRFIYDAFVMEQRKDAIWYHKVA